MLFRYTDVRNWYAGRIMLMSLIELNQVFMMENSTLHFSIQHSIVHLKKRVSFAKIRTHDFFMPQ